MPGMYQKLYTANFQTPTGVKSFDLIFSPDFTGTVAGIPKDGSVTASQTYGDGSDPIPNSMAVVVTTGSVEVSVNK